MRLMDLPSEARIQFDADPEWAEDFLGPEPDLSPVDASVWNLYWATRRSQPQDSMSGPLPLDLVRALDLNRRLYELDDERRVAEKLLAMDAAYLSDLTDRRERNKSKGDR